MVAPLVAGAVAGGIAALGGVVGQWLGGKSRKEAEAILSRARNEYGEIDVPALQQMAVEELGPGALEQLEADAGYTDAVRTGLAKLRQGVDSGGLTVEDRAAENEALDRSGRAAAAQRAAILNSFRARGAGGSGAELAAQLQAQSDDAEAAQRVGLNTAAEAQRRYWQQVQQLGATGLAAQGQDFNQRARSAEAADARARWNAQQRVATAQYNNDIADRNYQNQRARGLDMYNMAADQAKVKTGKADAIQNTAAGVGGALGQGVNNYFAWQRQKKDDE